MTIKEAREQLGWTQKKVFEELGIPIRTLQNWEAGSRKCPEWTEKLIIEKLQSMKEEEK